MSAMHDRRCVGISPQLTRAQSLEPIVDVKMIDVVINRRVRPLVAVDFDCIADAPADDSCV